MQTRIGLLVRLVVAIVFLGGLIPAQADWLETFDDNSFDLPTWQFLSYPSYTGSFGGTIQDEADANDYLILAETNSTAVGGSAFGIAVGAPEEFTDVRVGAVINAAGEAAQNYLSLVARVTYFMDDGSLSGHPGAVASGYVMLIHYQDGPANFRIEVMKIVNLSEDIMKTYHEVVAPGVDHARSYYAELEVVGSDPAYITGSIYEYQGGPLLVGTPTLVDTQGADPWENGGIHDAPLAKGVSAISSSNQDAEPAGYRATFDTVSSVAIDVADAHAKDVIVDNFEGYEDDSDIRVAWVPNITGFNYVSLNKDGDDEQLRFRYQNQYEPYFTEAVRTLEPTRNFALGGIGHLSLEFRGQLDNVTQPLFVLLEDAAGNADAVMYPSVLAPQTKFWREWQVSLQDFEGVDLTAIKKIGIKVGDGTHSAQALEDVDEILVNNVIVKPPQ
jgi:hypothetical protein